MIIAAVYQSASSYLGRRILSLGNHNAADEQTGALGDVEITLLTEENIVTCYEMKMKKVTGDDINRALQKISNSTHIINNYIFITTDIIEPTVQEYTASIYEQTGGIEVIVLDWINFLRYFLHLFHWIRMNFLEAYQEFVLSEPESAVSQALKEAFLALRQAAESNKGDK